MVESTGLDSTSYVVLIQVSTATQLHAATWLQVQVLHMTCVYYS